MQVTQVDLVAYIHQWYDVDNLQQKRTNKSPVPALLLTLQDESNVILGSRQLPGADPGVPLFVKNVALGDVSTAGTYVPVGSNIAMTVEEYMALVDAASGV